MDPLSFLPISTLAGAVGLLFWVARLVYTGRLVPRSALEDARREGAAWREAYLAEVARNRELTGQVGTFLATVRQVVS